jgi:hypothetical protein
VGMFSYNLQEETTTRKHHYAMMETIYHKVKKGAIIHLVLQGLQILLRTMS